MANYYINAAVKKSKINKEIYGHFSEHLGRCIYEGIYVGENSDIPNVNGMRCDVVEALKEIRVPVLRWPGGCFADEYHWKDGIGPKESRKKMINTHWGGVVENNSFGTHEYMELCRQLGRFTKNEIVSASGFDCTRYIAELEKKGYLLRTADIKKAYGSVTRIVCDLAEEFKTSGSANEILARSEYLKLRGKNKKKVFEFLALLG